MSDTIIANTLVRDVLHKRQGWELNPDKWTGFTTVLWWVLRKLGAVQPHMESTATYRFSPPKPTDSMLQAINVLLRERAYNHSDIKNYALVMGHEDYRTFMDEQQALMPLGHHPLHFDLKRYDGYESRVFNVPVHVIETIKGVALIPKVVIEKKADA